MCNYFTNKEMNNFLNKIFEENENKNKINNKSNNSENESENIFAKKEYFIGLIFIEEIFFKGN